MPHDPGKYLRDMLDHAIRIDTYTSGKSRGDFLKSDSLQDAVHWNLCVIGEALSQLRRVDSAMAQKLTGHAKIVGLRNQLIHGYGSIDTDLTWEIVHRHVPVLVLELRSLIG